MHVYVVFAHPSRNSFTGEVLRSFEHGLKEAGHSVGIADLYAMDFQTDMDIAQYDREMGPDPDAPVPPDVKREQEKVVGADAVAFVYPIWWSDCPAKLKGWFDRVLTHGFSYIRGGWSQRRKPVSIVKALLLCPAGHTVEDLERGGIARAMRTIMLDDRMPGLGVQEATMEILGGMTNDDGTHRRRNLRRAYQLGKTFGPSPRQLSEPAHTCCG
ncbi:MAG: NAD(P)H-dependent oxidoreductase [Planctomycetota bacterium]|jgi:NAD(P)H dehydrogenase (quinone)